MRKEFKIRAIYEIVVEEDTGLKALHTGLDILSEYSPTEWSVKQVSVFPEIPESEEVSEFSKRKEG